MLQRIHNISFFAVPVYCSVSIARLLELNLKRLSSHLQLMIKSNYLAISVSCLKRQLVCNFDKESICINRSWLAMSSNLCLIWNKSVL